MSIRVDMEHASKPYSLDKVSLIRCSHAEANKGHQRWPLLIILTAGRWVLLQKCVWCELKKKEYDGRYKVKLKDSLPGCRGGCIYAGCGQNATNFLKLSDQRVNRDASTHSSSVPVTLDAFIKGPRAGTESSAVNEALHTHPLVHASC